MKKFSLSIHLNYGKVSYFPAKVPGKRIRASTSIFFAPGLYLHNLQTSRNTYGKAYYLLTRTFLLDLTFEKPSYHKKTRKNIKWDTIQSAHDLVTLSLVQPREREDDLPWVAGGREDGLDGAGGPPGGSGQQLSEQDLRLSTASALRPPDVITRVWLE